MYLPTIATQLNWDGFHDMLIISSAWMTDPILGPGVSDTRNPAHLSASGTELKSTVHE